MPLPLHCTYYGQLAGLPIASGQLAHQSGVRVHGPLYHCVHAHQGLDSDQLRARNNACVPDSQGGAGAPQHACALREKDARALRAGLLLGHTLHCSGLYLHCY